ncbi:MAG: polysaccharide deacetylase family protein [Acidobacteriota bacterium]
MNGRSINQGLRIPVLMYHHVELFPLVPPAIFTDSYLDRAAFAAQLDVLAAAGLRTVTFAEACEMTRKGERPRRSVVLTFDDACCCFAEHAAPELIRRGMTATVFAVSSRLGGTNDWDHGAGERSEALMDAAALRSLAQQGFEIASHGRNHVDVSRCDEAALATELRDSKRDLESSLETPIRTFCYPYGRLDARARMGAERAGYLGAASIHGQPLANPHDPFAAARMIVRPGESALELRLKARGWYPLWSRLPRLGLLRALRRGKP